MKIGCVTRHSYPTAQEVRVTKFAETFHSHGHEFFVFCPGGGTQKSSELFEYGQIVRPRSNFFGSLGRLFFAPIPINPIWVWWFLRQFRKYSLSIVIVRDLRLALPVFFAARVCGIKAILDIGEHYPGMMEILGKQNLVHHIIRNHWLISKLETLSVSLADCVWVVVKENKKRLRQYSNNINVINNYPVFQGTEETYRVAPGTYTSSGDAIVLISLGLIDNIRGLDLAINAFSILAHELENVRLEIYGDGFFKEALEQQVKLLGLEKKVIFGGWISASQKYEVMAKGDIGLILHKVCDLTQYTVPNKLFDYMSVGLPVVSTNLEPIMQILDAEQCGIAVSENAEAVAMGLKALVVDVEGRKHMSENAFTAARSRYRWDTEEEKIIADVNLLVKDIS